MKDDASDDEFVFEIKDAGRTHTIKGTDLLAVFERAARQGKQGQYVIYFDNVGLTLTGTITKGKG